MRVVDVQADSGQARAKNGNVLGKHDRRFFHPTKRGDGKVADQSRPSTLSHAISVSQTQTSHGIDCRDELLDGNGRRVGSVLRRNAIGVGDVRIVQARAEIFEFKRNRAEAVGGCHQIPDRRRDISSQAKAGKIIHLVFSLWLSVTVY